MSPNQPDSLAGDSMAVAAAISQTARKGQWTVAVAESLTSGSLSCHLGAAEGSSDWYLGGVTAYSSAVKYKVLGVDRGPVITARCAEQMAAGVAKLTEADFSVAVTGAGGPGQEEGKPAGTVFIAVHSAKGTHVAEHHFTGDASHVVQKTTLQALRMLDSAIGGT